MEDQGVQLTVRHVVGKAQVFLFPPNLSCLISYDVHDSKPLTLKRIKIISNDFTAIMLCSIKT